MSGALTISYLSLASDSPDIPDTISGAEILRKGTPHSLAIALASAVLPHPGGPCSSTPRGGVTPSHLYTCGAAAHDGCKHGCPQPIIHLRGSSTQQLQASNDLDRAHKPSQRQRGCHLGACSLAQQCKEPLRATS